MIKTNINALPAASKTSRKDVRSLTFISRIHKTSKRYMLVGEPKSCIVQKHKIFAPERYTAGFLYTDS